MRPEPKKKDAVQEEGSRRQKVEEGGEEKKVVKKKKAPKKKKRRRRRRRRRRRHRRRKEELHKKKGRRLWQKRFRCERPTTGKKRALSKNKLITDTVAPSITKFIPKLPIVEEPSPAVAAADEKAAQQ